MCLFASLGLASLVAFSATAQTPTPSTTATSTPAAGDSAPARLPYGVDDVLKLSRAQVSEDVILNYIHNSGTIYNLTPKDIVYLRNQGVSDNVINTMLDQRKNVPAEASAQAVAANTPAASPAPTSPNDSAAATTQAAPQYAPTYAQGAPVDVEPQTMTYAAPSSVYVIPYYSTRFDYANAYPFYTPPYYYGPYYGGYYGPSAVFGFGYGYRGYYGRHYGRYYGGYHGGYYGHYGHR